MAGDLVNLLVGVFEAKHRSPWFRPSSWIIHRNLVADLVRGYTSEAFYQMQVLGRSQEVILRRKISGIHDQRFAFPMADRVAVPGSDIRGKMRAPIERN